MKRCIGVLLLALTIMGCSKKTSHPNYVEISGQILNAKSKEVTIFTLGGNQKNILLNEDGTFQDTFKVGDKRRKMQLILIQDKVMTPFYAENGANVNINADASNFKNSIKFGSDFADENSYFVKKELILKSDSGFDNKTWFRLNPEAFKARRDTLKSELMKALTSYNNISQEFMGNEEKDIDKYLKRISADYKEEHAYSTKLSKGKMSPEFENYENYNGKTTSLSDFKGHYVFIDVWATWCSPCKAQIPFLEELEKKYKDKNIVFVSMSVDSEKDKEKWKKMVADKALSGVQIIAPNQTSSEFTKSYFINSIPRFILIDPDGKIVDSNAPRPSDKKAIEALLSVI